MSTQFVFWKDVLIPLGVGVLSSGVAGLIVGRLFEVRSNRTLAGFQDSVVDGVANRLAGAVQALSQNTRPINSMAADINKLVGAIRDLSEAVRKAVRHR
jgi:hypothetical protein